MPAGGLDLKASSERELNVLKGVIDYADRMIYEDRNFSAVAGMADPTGFHGSSQAPLYKLLRKNAFAKTVLIETELQGVLEFRLSSTEAVYPNSESGYCTPHSTVGRLATICHPGYESRSKLWGDFCVLEVRTFDRFGGPEFEPNVRNFLKMILEREHDKEWVHDLRSFLAKSRNVKPSPYVKDHAHLQGAADASPVNISNPSQPQVESKPLPNSELLIAKFAVVDETEKFSSDIDMDEELEWSVDDAPTKQEDYYGLSERFFTHQTVEQNKIISRSPLGPMFVEGIAGSGKTSAALGRTKMLTTFDATKITSKEDFYDVLGEDQDYWSAEFAGQFSQEGSIGFVRTGELIQYLQETCRRIDLPDLPVQEYKELQTRLREHRALARSATPGKRWAGLTQPRDAHAATTMAWLHATDRAMARQIAATLAEGLPAVTEFSAPFEPEVRQKVNLVCGAALTALHKDFQEVALELTQSSSEAVFRLDRLAVRLLNKIDDVRKHVMGSKVIWSQLNHKPLFASDENGLARQLIANKAALYFRAGQRLVFVDEAGPIDKSLSLLSLTGQPVTWTNEVRELMSAGKIVVREPSERNVHAVLSDVNHLYLRLLPEATERIYVLAGNELRRLPLEMGLGRIRLPLIPVESAKGELLEPIEDELDATVEVEVQGQPRNRTPDSEFKKIVTSRVLQPLATLADLYLKVLADDRNSFPDLRLAQSIKLQLEQFKLAEEDIDLLLCISHLIGRELKQGGLRQLQEPSYYQSVFVDEVQDFTEQQVYLMGEQANPKYRAVTVVGDTAQKLHHGSTIDLRGCFPNRGVDYVQLTENLRQADMPGLALFSACFRWILQGGVPPTALLASEVRMQGDALVRPNFKVCETEKSIDDQIIETLLQAKSTQTLAVLFPDAGSAEVVYQRLEQRLREHMIDSELSEKINLARRHVRHFSDVTKSKGLEFDVVVLVGLNKYNLKNATHVNRLYVGITRARKNLVLITGRKQLSAELDRVLNQYRELVGLPTDRST